MNMWVVAAGALSSATVLLHVIGGGTTIHSLFLQSELPIILKAFASILWHAVTVILITNSAALFIAAAQQDTRTVIVWFVACQYIGFAGLFIFYGLSRLGSLWTMPQWVIFLTISGLALMSQKSTVE